MVLGKFAFAVPPMAAVNLGPKYIGIRLKYELLRLLHKINSLFIVV
jgi:hypothetical protein